MLVELLSAWVMWTISALGYAGIFFMMMMESMVLPLPSELVLPFTGFLVYAGRFGMIEATIAATLGSVAGSLLMYWIGMKFGCVFVEKYGKYFLLNIRHLDMTHRFFEKYGSMTIFAARLIPVVRHFISLPAGAAKMNMKKFIAFTAAGAFLWNFFLIYVGYKLREQWSLILNYAQLLDIIIVLAIICFIAYLIIEHRKNRPTYYV